VKLLIPILIGIIVLGGTAVGLGYAGVLNIPGLTPKKRTTPQADPQSAKPANETQAETPTVTPEPAPAAGTPPAATTELTRREDGTERLAKVWAEMEIDVLVKVLSEWNDGDALAVIARMDDKKIAEILNALPADRAARISIGIKALEKGGK
jgi:hypothetical protein